MKKDVIVRALLALAAGLVLTVFLAQGRTLGFIVRTAMYFSVLFVGYKFGIGVGAAAGTGCGIIETLLQGDISVMGMLCLTGVLSGLFRSLGKAGSTLGFLAGASAAGILYLPEQADQGIAEFFIVAAVFLLIPRALCRQTEIRKAPVRPFPFYMPGRELTAARRVQSVSDSMEKLAGTFSQFTGDAFLPDDGACTVEEGIPSAAGSERGGSMEDLVWKGRYRECREAVAESFKEVERILSEISEDIEATEDLSELYRDKISRELRMRRVKVDNLMVLEKRSDKREIYLTVRASGNRCMTVRELAETVSAVIGEKFLPSLDSKRIVTREACTVRLLKAPAYMMLHGIARASREGEGWSGDNFTFCQIQGGRMLFGVADGMGSGRRAFRDSEVVMELAEQLMNSGFELERAIRLMNSVLLLKEQEQRPITVDLAAADLYSGTCEFVKAGGVTTFIKRGREIETIRADGLPAGVLSQAEPEKLEKKLKDGDKIVMVTDGVLDALEGEDKEETMREILACTSGENLQDTADEILQYAMMSGPDVRDDMTVLSVGIWKA